MYALVDKITVIDLVSDEVGSTSKAHLPQRYVKVEEGTVVQIGWTYCADTQQFIAGNYSEYLLKLTPLYQSLRQMSRLGLLQPLAAQPKEEILSSAVALSAEAASRPANVTTGSQASS